MDLRIIGFLALGLSGCSSETIYLQNVAGDQVQCGKYMGVPAIYLFSLLSCVEDFQEAGYQEDILEAAYQRVQVPK